MCDVRGAEGHVSNCASRAGSGLWLRQESAGQHQDSEADPGRGHVAAEDVLESGSAQHRPVRAKPKKGSDFLFHHKSALFSWRIRAFTVLISLDFE